MEEALEATAIAVNYLRSAILEMKSRDLLDLARGVREAADAAGVDCDCLVRAAGALRDLRQADDEERIRAVLELGDSSAALEKIACAPLIALRGAAAHLARACREYQEAADSIFKARRTMERRARRTFGSWCSSIWRRSQIQQAENLAADVELGGQPKLLSDNIRASIDLMSDAQRELEEKAAALVLEAKNLVAAADGAGVPLEELVFAISALEHAGVSARLDFIVHLGSAATAMEKAKSTSENVLRDRAADLTRGCRSLTQAADAMAAVQRAAAAQRERRAAGTAAAAAEAAAPVPRDKPDEGEDKRSSMAGYGLFGSVGLIPYLGPDMIAAKVKALSPNDKWWLTVLLGSSWTLVALGVPCGAYAQSIYELVYAQLSSRLGIVGMNVAVILFIYFVIGIEDRLTLYLMLGGACVLHSLFILAAFWRHRF